MLSTLGAGVVTGGATGATYWSVDGQGRFTARRMEAGPAAAELGAGGVCAVADFTGDGASDILQVFEKGLALYAGTPRAGEFSAPVITRLAVVAGPAVVVCGDWDADGRLDLMVGGAGGFAVLTAGEKGAWTVATRETGELGVAGGAHVVAANLCDMNGDGRQGVAFLHKEAGPGLFFNRGFASLGVARSLSFAECKLPAAEALGGGQQTGAACDLNGDGYVDLVGVDAQQNVRALLGGCQDRRVCQVLATVADGARGPLTVSVLRGQRSLGLWAIRPGELTTIGAGEPGKVSFQWRTADGNTVTREVVVVSQTKARL